MVVFADVATSASEAIGAAAPRQNPFQRKRRLRKQSSFLVIFAFGELYCFAVIFGLRPSDIRFASFNGEYNITSALAEISLCR